MRRFLVVSCFAVMVVLAIALFPVLAKEASTFTGARQNREQTMTKYESSWTDNQIITKNFQKNEYLNGEITGYITIPAMDIYELPVYYGENDINNNWQITTAGYLGNWGMLTDKKAACIGAHNYQLFQTLPKLKAGDKFIVENETDIYVYEVTGTAVYVAAKDDWRHITV